MTRLAGVSAVLLVAFISACSSGDDPLPIVDGADVAGRVCTTELTTTGTYTIDATVTEPAGMVGCWGVGTWTFSTAVVQGMDLCASHSPPVTPTYLPSYSFKVNWVLDQDGNGGYAFAWLGDAATHTIVKISGDTGNGGLCAGELSVFSNDGTEVWNLRPILNPDNTTLSGTGEYQKFKTDQWIGQ